MRSGAFLQVQLAAVKAVRLEAGQKRGLIYVLKGATQVRGWRLDRKSSKIGSVASGQVSVSSKGCSGGGMERNHLSLVVQLVAVVAEEGRR